MIKAVPCFICATPCILSDSDEYHCPRCDLKAAIRKVPLKHITDYRPGALKLKLIDGHFHALELSPKIK